MAYPRDHSLKVYTEPSYEPLTAAEAAEHLRVTGTDEATAEGALIASYVKAARMYCEKVTGRAFVNRTYEMKLHAFENLIEVPKPPLSSVTSIAYVDEDGVSQTVSSSVYTVDTASEPGRIYPAYDQEWPTDIRAIPHPITIRYVAGYGASAASAPEPVRSACRLLLGHWYANREDVVVGTIQSSLIRAVDDLLWPYRMEAV